MSLPRQPLLAWCAGGAAVLALALLVVAAYWPTLDSMARIWVVTVTYRHDFLVPVVAAVLVWRQRERLAATAPRQEPLVLVPVALAVVAWLVGQAAGVQVVSHAAVVALLVLTVPALLGRAVARVIAFPLLFLFAMVPVGDGLTPWMQDLTARLAVVLLHAVGFPASRDGVLITTPSAVFEVAENCAGLRFLLAGLIVAALLAHLAYRRPWKWALLMALAAAIPIVANGFRIVASIYFGSPAVGMHTAGVTRVLYGWSFFTVVTFSLLAFGRLLVDGDPPAPAGASPVTQGTAPRPLLVLALASLLLAGPVYAGTVLHPPAIPRQAVPPDLPLSSAWRRVDVPAPAWRPHLEGTDLTVAERWTDGTRTVDTVVGWYAFERERAKVVYWPNRMDGELGWVRAGGGSEPLAIPGLPETVRVDRLVGPAGKRLVLSWYWVAGRFTADPVEAKLLELGDRLFGRTRPASVLAVSAAGEPAQARATLEAFLRSGFAAASYLGAIRSGD